MKKVSVTIDEIRQKCEQALTARGAWREEAKLVVDDDIDADLCGRESHGLASFSVALGQFPKGGEFEVVDRGRSHLTIDGHGNCGHIVARDAVQMGCEIANDSGICAVDIHSFTRFACPDTIARFAARKGMIGIVLEYGSQNFMVPPGGKEPALSTNPIGIGIPVAEGALFVLDVATSSRAIGFVGLAKLAGESIPSDWAIGEDGAATTDPASVKAVTPFAGYKGYGLSFAFEILSGILVGTPVGKAGKLGNRGAMIILTRPDIFGVPADDFMSKVTMFLNDVVDTSTVDGAKVSYPGQMADNRRSKGLASNTIELPAGVVAQLDELTQPAEACCSA